MPLALIILALAMLLTTPFLNLAGTNLLGVRAYAEVTEAEYASDAGVEHALWSLAYGTLSDSFVNPGDSVNYQLPQTVNGLIPDITVTANAIATNPAGLIDDAIIDTLEYSTSHHYPDIIHIANDIYAIVHDDGRNDGWLRTVRVSPAGIITDTLVDSWEFQPSNGEFPDIVHVSGNIYAISYQGPGSDGWMMTVNISDAGDITNSAIDTLEFDPGLCNYPEIIHVSGDYFAIAYQGIGSDGFVKTVRIQSNGQIDNSTVDSLEFDTGRGVTPKIISIASDIYAIVYSGPGSDGWVCTVDISTTGIIGNSVTDSFEFNTSRCNFPDIEHISGNVYAITYNGASPTHGELQGGIVTSITIQPGGTITQSIIDQEVFEASTIAINDLIQVSGDLYAVAYALSSDIGTIKTLNIESDGNITGTIIDTLIYEASRGDYPTIISVGSGVYAIAYTGPGTDGFIITIGIDTGGSGSSSADYEIISVADTKTTRVLTNIIGANITITSWE